jgi:hypothetical protein
MLPLPNYILDHTYSFLDFHTIIKLISIPSVYRYLLTLVHFADYMDQPIKDTVLETLEPYYHLNRYNGINIFDMYKFINGTRIIGNNISYGVTRELWVHNFEWHRVYGPAVIYKSASNKFPYREGWYYNGVKHREGGPSVIIYFDNGRVHYEGYTYYDVPYKSDGGPTTVEYDKKGELITEVWQNKNGTIKMIKRLI